MKLKILLLTTMLSGCQTSPPISLVYRRFEPVRGGRIVVTRSPEFQEEVQKFDDLEHKIMFTFCSSEDYRIIDEGIVAKPGEIETQRLPYGRSDSIVRYSVAQYKNFVCGMKPLGPEFRGFGPNSN